MAARPTADVVVPVAGDAPSVRALAARMRSLQLAPGDTCTVVDNRGVGVPGALVADRVRTSYFARNAGAAAGHAEWIVFLDADVVAPTDLLELLLADPVAKDVAVLAGGVRDEPGATPAARYAARRGAMAQETTLVGRGPWGFAQTAHCAVRRQAFEQVGGFVAGVRSGGDADLCFRLRDAGWRLESRAQAVVTHRSRASVPALLANRFRHGTGAAWLDARWPGSLPARPLPGVAWWALRRAAQGLAARRRGDVDAAVDGLLDGPAVLAFELGRRVPNVPLRGQRR